MFWSAESNQSELCILFLTIAKQALFVSFIAPAAEKVSHFSAVKCERLLLGESTPVSGAMWFNCAPGRNIAEQSFAMLLRASAAGHSLWKRRRGRQPDKDMNDIMETHSWNLLVYSLHLRWCYWGRAADWGRWKPLSFPPQYVVLGLCRSPRVKPNACSLSEDKDGLYVVSEITMTSEFLLHHHALPENFYFFPCFPLNRWKKITIPRTAA